MSENFCPALTASKGPDPEEVARSLCAGMPLRVRQSVLARVSPHIWFHPRKAGIAEGVGDAVSGNVMMRMWPSVLKAAVFTQRKAIVRDFWASSTCVCRCLRVLCARPVRRRPGKGRTSDGAATRGLAARGGSYAVLLQLGGGSN